MVQTQSSRSPLVTHGPISGEVTDTSVVLWARGNQTGTLTFTLANTPDFQGVDIVASVGVGEWSDFTGKVQVTGLTPSQRYYYRVTLSTGDEQSPPVTGEFLTAPLATLTAAFSFLFSSCLGGQGYCRDPETGWLIFETMLAQQADLFLFLGDSIYADTVCPAPPNVPGAEGPYHDLAGFRTRYRYHLEDTHYATFLAHTPVYVTWDDHEIINDFSGPGLQTTDPERLAVGLQAYFEYWPLLGVKADPYRIYRRFAYGAHADFFILDTRTYRDTSVKPALEVTRPFRSMLGTEQFLWLQQGLAESEATWKFIATSVPLAYPTGWPRSPIIGYDGWANSSELSGYEAEFMALLTFIERHKIKNLIFLSGDTHWPYALSYDPDRDGQPNFYEFGCSPLSALTLAPVDPPDLSFNPTVLYAEGEFKGNLFNFGQIRVAADGSLTFRVIDWTGRERFSLTLQPSQVGNH